MAEKIASAKRKGELGAVDAKSSKKVKLEKASKSANAKPMEPTKPTKPKKPTNTKEITPAVEAPVRRKSSRVRAADLFDMVEDAIQPAPALATMIKPKSVPEKKTKAKKNSESVVELKAKPSAKSKQEPEVTKPKATKASRKSKAVEALEDALEDLEGLQSDNENEEADASNLLAGFESSDDSGSESGQEGIAMEKLPLPPPANGAAVKDAENRRSKNSGDEPGTLYIGHIPHGFYERQMHAYFSQFGTISRLRLARNRQTGAPKHYAFIEFASADVADIVQRTMDKYLLFNHILQVRKMAKEQVHEKMWKGSESRFKVIPWGAIEGRGLKVPREQELWKKRVGREEKRRQKRKAILSDYGYDFEIPAVKQVAQVAEKGRVIENSEVLTAMVNGDEAPEAVEPEQVVATKQKKSKKQQNVAEVPVTAEVQEPDVVSKPKKGKKAQRSVSDPIKAVEPTKERKSKRKSLV